MKRTLLYFGSFNPVHLGHMVIANMAVTSGKVDELWFVVSPQNPFKPCLSLVSASDRVEMVQMAIEQTGLEERVSVRDVELHLPTPSYTIQTLEALWESYPEREFGILMGSDNFACIRKWKESDKILERCPIFVYDRPSCPTQLPDNLPNVTVISDVPLLDISASRIRHWLAEGKYIPAMLPCGIYEYIKENGLYRIDD